MILTEPIDEKLDKIPLSEVFESIQGEGPFMGRRALFIRFAGCNLANVCKSCDTDFRARMFVTKEWIVQRIMDYVNKGGWLVVFTGGEPGLYKHVIDDIVWEVKCKSPKDVQFQVETNGIIKMGDEFIVQGGIVVVSPKKGFEEYALKNYAGKNYAHFKVVVGAPKDDPAFWSCDEGEGFINKFLEEHSKSNVWVMPWGGDEETLKRTRRCAWEMAVRLGINYSDRLHVVTYGESISGV